MASDGSQRQQGDSMSTTEAAPARTGADKSVAATPVRRRPSDFACKQVMAVTGIVFGLFVLLHMLGNLKAYLGRGGIRQLRGVAAPHARTGGSVFQCAVGHSGGAAGLPCRARELW